MPDSPLQSSWSKFNWAQKHLAAFDSALQRSFDPQRHAVSVKAEIKVSGDTAEAIVRVASIPIVRDDCGLTLGDALQNFRATLDHLAWDLVKLGSIPRPKRPQDIYFPMAKSFQTWKGRVDDWLPGVPPKQRATIRRYQPYRRGPQSRAMRLLRDLSDHDKHRVMVPIAMNTQPNPSFTVQSHWTVSTLHYLVNRPMRLKVNTPLARIDLVRPRGFTGGCDVNVNGQFSVYPALPGGQPASRLGEIRETVFEILSEFDAIL